MSRILKVALLGTLVGLTALTGVSQAQYINEGLEMSEEEYWAKRRYGYDYEDYWNDYWRWYDDTYSPYYRGRASAYYRRPLDHRDRQPVDAAPDYHDYYTDDDYRDDLRTRRDYIDEDRPRRRILPSYRYPSSGYDARLRGRWW